MQHFIYTSTVNVMFGDQPIHNGDESHPYAPEASHTDQYSITKTIAEKAVLAANGTPCAGRVLLCPVCCVLCDV